MFNKLKNNVKKINFNQIRYYEGYYVQKNIYNPNINLKKETNLKNKTALISGGSRGIGLSIAENLCKNGANVVIASKTTETQKDLPGTIYTAVDECNKHGMGVAFPVQMDLRNEDSILNAIDETIKNFGSIDFLINNASAVHIEHSKTISSKKYDLMHSINGRGTFIMSKSCIPHLAKSRNPHILSLCPPLDSTINNPFWFKMTGTAYITAKLQMSLQVLGLSQELKEFNIGCNALWPRTTIATSAIKNVLGGSKIMNKSRSPEIMADAANIILTSNSEVNTGNFYIDDEVLVGSGFKDLEKYRINKDIKEHELIPDFFV